MHINRLVLENWKNFRRADLAFEQRVFVIGPNASGKSNLLDALRFARDVANPEGGFQRAVRARGGVSKLRCLHARKYPNIAVEVSVNLESVQWSYRLEFKQDKQRRPLVERERVLRNGSQILDRPTKEDRDDPSRLSQTHLEQVNANREFRAIADFLSDIRYLHIVPQLIREPERVVYVSRDPYGSDFLDQISRTSKRTLDSRLRRINEALRVAVPQLQELKLEKDDRGVPHLKGLYEHWRPKAGWQTEESFSDGTLRLLGLLWAFLDGSRPLLLEEPELSLHASVVRYIPVLMQNITRKSQRQIIVSTHSSDLLSDVGISSDEVVLLQPTSDGTRARVSSSFEEIEALVASGIPVGEAAMPYAAPEKAHQLALFDI